MKKIMRITAALLTVACVATANINADTADVSVITAENTIQLMGSEKLCAVNGEIVTLKDKSYVRNGRAYISVDDVLPALGYAIGWDVELGAVTCTKEEVVSYIFPTRNNMWVGATEYVFDHKPLIVSGRAYISDKMLATLTGYAVSVDGSLDEYQPVILNANEASCAVGSVWVPLSRKAFSYNGQAYLPLDEILPSMGYAVSWDSAQKALVCVKDGVVSYVYPYRKNIWVGPDEFVFDHFPAVVRGKTYVSEKVFTALTGSKVSVNGALKDFAVVTLVGNKKHCLVNGQTVTMKDKAYLRHGKPYIPLEDILPAMGYTIGWDANVSGITCTKNGVVSYVFPKRKNIWVGPVEHVFENLPTVIGDRTYVPVEMFETLTGCEVDVEGKLSGYKDGKGIKDSKRSDAHRLAKNNVHSGNGVTVVNGFAMELVSVSKSNAVNYASVINSVAASLDKNINVYNMIVPTAAEYYAPLSMYPNQLQGIQTVYANLSSRVIPVNVYDVLAEKAGEKIYFKTDHHWTQRGAYYAYKEFMAYQGVAVPELSTFKNVPSNSFVGSFATFARGTYAGTIVQNSPELLERFVPNKKVSGKVYSNQNLSSPLYSVDAVNTRNNGYGAFIGGDNPIVVFDTNANSDKVLVIIKESFGNAFATWAVNDYKKVCVIDPRRFNGFGGNNTPFNLNQFCRKVGATDVMFINYPIVVGSAPIKNSILKMK